MHNLAGALTFTGRNQAVFIAFFIAQTKLSGSLNLVVNLVDSFKLLKKTFLSFAFCSGASYLNHLEFYPPQLNDVAAFYITIALLMG